MENSIMMTEIDDTRIKKLIEAFKSESSIEIFDMLWKVSAVYYYIRDGKSITTFDLDMIDAPHDGVSHNLIEGGITGSMSLKCDWIIPEKWT